MIGDQRLLIEMEVVVKTNGVYGPGTHWTNQEFGVLVARTGRGEDWRGGITVVKELSPVEPPVNTILVDRTGLAWQRLTMDADGPEVWFCTGETRGLDWETLWNTFGPLKEPWKD